MNAMGRYLNYIRLALFPLSYGIVGALMGSTLNRVMLADIGFRAIWVGFFFAAPDLIAPIRVWLGYRSDGFPIWGRRREPYIILGALVTGGSVYLVTQLATIGEVSNVLLLLAIVLAFVIYGPPVTWPTIPGRRSLQINFRATLGHVPSPSMRW